MTRYVATFDRYFWANTDEEAIEQAKDFADKVAKINDNHCQLTSMVEQPFGTITNRQVYGDAIEYKEVTQ